MAKIKPPAFRNRYSISGFVAWNEIKQAGLLNLIELERDEKVLIIQHAYPWFKPLGWTKPKNSKYDKKWWDSLTGDQQTVRWALAFPERCRAEGTLTEANPIANVSFYDTVSEHNARAWYTNAPEHLRKVMDAELDKLPKAVDAKKTDRFYQEVSTVWGERPELPEDHADGEGLRKDENFVIEVWCEWCLLYTEKLEVDYIVTKAPTLQKERRMLNQALGINNVDGFPVQAEGLDDTQAATVRWIQETGQTPIEFLAETYRDPDQKASDRIAAARAMLDFVHRKIPSKQEIETKDVSAPKIDPKTLKGLTEKELNTLEALLKKASQE